MGIGRASVPSGLPGEGGDRWGALTAPRPSLQTVGDLFAVASSRERGQAKSRSLTCLALASLQPRCLPQSCREPPKALQRWQSRGSPAQAGLCGVQHMFGSQDDRAALAAMGTCGRAVTVYAVGGTSPQLFSFPSSPRMARPGKGSCGSRQRDPAMPQFPCWRSVGDAGLPAVLRWCVGGKDERGRMTQTLP